MKEWLRDQRLTLLLVGVAVPLMGVLCFSSTIRPGWPFWIACYIIGLPAGVAVIWVRQSGADLWIRLTTLQRILLRCLAVFTLWSVLFLQLSERSNRFLTATAMSVVLLLFWGSYVVFSRLLDRIWSRIRRR
jgi:hypothetical protein